jgi:Anti-sigma-K factor rskA
MADEHEELENAILGLLLGSTGDDERPRLLAHLQSCSSCRELAARLGPVTAVLPLEPDSVEPPARLHGRVLAAVAAAGQEASPPPRRRQLLPLPLSRRLRVAPAGFRPAQAAAALLLFALGAGVGAGAVLGRPFGQSNQVQSQVARYTLRGTGSMAGVQSSAVYLRSDGLTLVDFRDMPPTQANQVYELWLITTDGRALPAGVFVPDPNGSKIVLVTQDLRGTRELAVTIEPGPNGSPVPTQQSQLKGEIA